jgi:NitT/TauT family transport system permease protein
VLPIFMKFLVSILRRYINYFLVTAGIAIWYMVSFKYGELLIPSPLTVLYESFLLVTGSHFYSSLFLTLLRIFVSLFSSFLISLLLIFICMSNKYVQKIIDLVMRFTFMLPQTVIVFLILILMKPTDPATIVIAIVLCLMPNIYLILSNGVSSIDKQYLSVGKIYKLNKRSELIDIILPGMSSYLFTAFQTGLSLAWRSTMLVEMFSFTGGVGYQIYYEFQTFSLKGVLSWTLSFVVVIFLVEKLMKYIFQKINVYEK